MNILMSDSFLSFDQAEAHLQGRTGTKPGVTITCLIEIPPFTFIHMDLVDVLSVVPIISISAEKSQGALHNPVIIFNRASVFQAFQQAFINSRQIGGCYST
jgi:hypothetical protein